MTMPADILSVLVTICLITVAVTPIVLLLLWYIDWKRKSLW